MEKTSAELKAENKMLRQEIKVAREAAAITARLVVKQFEKTDRTLRHLEAANAQRRAVLNAATQLSIISTDLEGKITLFNSGAGYLLGFSREEMVDKQNISILHVKEELRQYAHVLTGVMPMEPNAIDIFAQHVKQHVFQAHEWTYVCKNGTLLPVNLSITAFYNARGIMRGYLFTAMDMSSQKQMKQELILAMEDAEAANASKGDFLARMSHEIRTPMNGIIGMAHLMEKTPLNDLQRNFLDRIQSSARTLLTLINDILDFSKIDAGKLTLECIDFRLEDVLANVVNTIGFMAEDKGLEFLFQVDQKVPSKLRGDPLRLGQILLNLAGNAIKFTEKGEIVIAVSLHDPSDVNYCPAEVMPGKKHKSDFKNTTQGNKTSCHDIPDSRQAMLKFSVKDSGVGLHADQITSLFEAFNQADDSITRKYGGTGLGLSICSQLTRMMGGNIWVESAPNEGSTFIFTAKLACSLPPPAPSPDQELRSFHGKHALVVDDNRTARELLVSMLKSFGMEVDSAPDGQTAIDLLENSLEHPPCYDVVLLDWIMPGMDGIETARRIKSHEGLDRTPTMLMVTAKAREEVQMAATETGIKAFLLKPVYTSVMYNTLQESMGLAPASPVDPLGPGARTDVPLSTAMENIRGANILLVEDNAINQEVARAFLEDVGMVVDIADNGQACLDIIDKKTFDLILMDIQMPVLDGLETTRIIRNEKKRPHLPIIAMTAHAMAGDQEKSLRAGMNGHLNKPVNPARLYEVLQQFIPGKQGKNISGKTCESTPSTMTKKVLGNPAPSQDLNPSPTPVLPALKGIDQVRALSRLNHKPELLLTLLHDFKETYQNHPAYLQELLAQNDTEKIKVCAHTIKGISGYMAADGLYKSAEDLENRLKAIPDKLPMESILGSTALDKPNINPLVQKFIDEINQLLNTLEHLPKIKTKHCLDHNPLPGVPMARFPRQLTVLNEKQTKVLQEFTNLLTKGEFTAMDLLPDVKKILIQSGCEEDLTVIADLMDDIEFERAAERMALLTGMANTHGTSHDK
ncbi:PAS domain-containing hybrid sensor histidine kinase/response regulator [Desulfocicer niacini]